MAFDSNFLVVSLIIIATLETLVVLWLWRRQQRLENRLQRRQKIQERQQLDIVGLCAAAVRMDERLINLSRRLGEMHEWAQDLEQHECQTELSYQAAIERIKQGAGTDDLVAECGFSREEAALLIRMHRSDPGSVGY